MTEFEATILQRLANLESKVKRLESEKSAAEKAVDFEALPDSATVGKDYAAYRFGCSERAVVRKEAGTHLLKPICRKPLKFIKKEVDAAFRQHTKPAADRAVEAIAKARPVRRRSIVKRQPAEAR